MPFAAEFRRCGGIRYDSLLAQCPPSGRGTNMAQQSDDSPKRTLPADVNPETLSRLSPLRRDTLSAEGMIAYDAMTQRRPDGKNLAGLQGPGGVWIRLPALGKHLGELNRILRSEIGLEARLTEVAILATAREMHSQFEWTMHEPVAAREGLDAHIIDIIKYRMPLTGVPEMESAIIALAREAIGARQVSPQTYARALKAFGEVALLNLVALMATYAMTAMVLRVVDQQLHDGQDPLLPAL
jgi:4-carboxymuconolactone decarboxylase